MGADADAPATGPQPGEGGPLLAMFPPATAEHWRRMAERELAGAPLDQLTTPTYEGVDLRPIYWPDDTASLPDLDAAPGVAPFLRGGSPGPGPDGPWLVCEPIGATDPAEARALALRALAQGATALSLTALAPADVPAALTGVDPRAAAVFLAAPPGGALAAGRALAAWAGPAARGAVACDPLAALALGSEVQLDAAWGDLAALAGWAAAEAPGLATVAADASPYHEAGGSAAEELAFGLAAAVEHIRALAARGVAPDVSAPRLRMTFAVGQQLFLEVAKLRAARLLWARAASAFGAPPERCSAQLHARGALRGLTLADPHTNMVRAAVAALAAAAAGCDSMELPPFDAPAGAGELGRRVARNTQLLLRDESQVGAVRDPAGGSYYVESLTDALARRAWALFQDVERRGGLAPALREGFPQAAVAETAALRARDLAEGRRAIVGATRYADEAAALPEAPARPPAPAGALAPRRDSEPAEEARRARGAGRADA